MLSPKLEGGKLGGDSRRGRQRKAETMTRNGERSVRQSALSWHVGELTPCRLRVGVRGGLPLQPRVGIPGRRREPSQIGRAQVLCGVPN